MYFFSPQLAKFYLDGKRLPQGSCNMTIYTIIYKCWSSDPNQRPSFGTLATELQKLLQAVRQRSGSGLKQEVGDASPARTTMSTANGSANFTAHNGAAAVAQLVS